MSQSLNIINACEVCENENSDIVDLNISLNAIKYCKMCVKEKKHLKKNLALIV